MKVQEHSGSYGLKTALLLTSLISPIFLALLIGSISVLEQYLFTGKLPIFTTVGWTATTLLMSFISFMSYKLFIRKEDANDSSTS